MRKYPQFNNAVQYIHSLTVVTIVVLVCIWEVVQLYQQLFPAK